MTRLLRLWASLFCALVLVVAGCASNPNRTTGSAGGNAELGRASDINPQDPASLKQGGTLRLALTSFPALVLASIVIALRHRDVLDFLKTPAAVILLVAPPLVLWGGMTLSTGW